MFTRRRLVFLLCFSFLFFAVCVLSYDNLITHPKLTESAINIYEQEAGKYLNYQQTNWIIKGSIDEDNDPRYLNHFYNPQTGRGLNDGWFHGQSAKNWAFSQDSATGDYSVGAIFNNYRNGDLMRAYQGIGHILHLIQDMSVPAHVRNDAHPSGDPFEEWAEHYGTINADKIQKININSIENVFDDLAFFTSNNFFSKDTIVIEELDKYKIDEELIDNRKRFYLINKIDKQEYKLVYSKNPDSIMPVFQIDDDFKLNLDYWNMLYPKAVGYSAGVIEYFIKEFKKIDQEKNETTISLWQKIKNSTNNLSSDLAYTWGDTFIDSRIRLDNILASAFSGYTKSQQGFEFFAEANREILTDLSQRSVNIAQNLSGKVLSAEDTISKQQIQTKIETEVIQDLKKNNPDVARVIDGDTIELTTGEKVRYIGIDTPELNSEGSDDDECLAWLARLRNMELLSMGELKLVEDSTAKTDKYGRLLRYVYINNLFVNDVLVKEGLAEIFFCQPGWENCPVTTDKNKENIIKASNQEAKNNARGIYSGVCDKEDEPEKEIIKKFEDKIEEKIILEEKFIENNTASTSTSTMMQLPLVCAPAHNNDSDNTNVVVSEIANFSVFDITSSSTNIIASTTVGLSYTISNQEAVEGYFLSEASTTPAIDDASWETTAPSQFVLSSSDGKKIIYFWLKYNSDNITNFVSSTIILDTTAPTMPMITSIEPLSDIYWVNTSEVLLSGEKEIGVDAILINGVAYSATSSEETWNVNYTFDFICSDSSSWGNLVAYDCMTEYCNGHKEECDGLSDEEMRVFFYERELILKAKNEAGNYSEEAEKVFRLDNFLPKIWGALSTKSIPSSFVYFYMSNLEDFMSDLLFFNSGVSGYEFEYKFNDSEDWVVGEIVEVNYPNATLRAVLSDEGNFDLRFRMLDFAGNVGEWYEGLTAEVNFYPVISEIYMDEINSGSEWIELYNPSVSDIDIGGWVIDTKADEEADVTLPDDAIIPAYGFYFIGDQVSGEWNPDNVDWIVPDYTETMTLTNDDGWVRLRKSTGGEIVDTVGWQKTKVKAEVYEGREVNTFGCKEGYSIERLNMLQVLSDNTDLYQNKGNNFDRNYNSGDFVVRETPNPQNSSSAVEGAGD